MKKFYKRAARRTEREYCAKVVIEYNYWKKNVEQEATKQKEVTQSVEKTETSYFFIREKTKTTVTHTHMKSKPILNEEISKPLEKLVKIAFFALCGITVTKEVYNLFKKRA